LSLSCIWHSAPAFFPTGYGVQTANFVSRMIDDGHECVIMTTTQQPSITWNGITHIPGGGEKYAASGMLEWPRRVKTDILFTLFDIWPFPEDIGSKIAALGTAWAPITPIDHDPVPQEVVARLKHAAYPIAMSPHGFREMQRSGLTNATYIPHGVDTHVFRPRQPNKELFKTNNETFVVGVIGTNIEPLDRKGWYPTLAAFGKFHAKYPNSILYVHATPTRDDGGYDLMRIAESFGFKLHAPDMWTLTAGLPVLKMVELYNSLDVMMLLTRGEGFCIPLIEAQSCGVPVITTDFTAPSDLVGAGWKVPSIGTRYTVMNSFWAEPDIDAGARALEQCYQLWRAGELREEMQQKARNFAKTFDFDLVYKTYMRPFLEKAEAEIREKQNAAKTAQGDDGVRQATSAEQGRGVHNRQQRPSKGNGRGSGGNGHSSSKRRRHRIRPGAGNGSKGQVQVGPECEGDRETVPVTQ